MYILTENQKMYADFVIFKRKRKSIYGITKQNKKHRIVKFKCIEEAKEFLASLMLEDRLYKHIENGYINDTNNEYIRKKTSEYIKSRRKVF